MMWNNSSREIYTSSIFTRAIFQNSKLFWAWDTEIKTWLLSASTTFLASANEFTQYFAKQKQPWLNTQYFSLSSFFKSMFHWNDLKQNNNRRTIKPICIIFASEEMSTVTSWTNPRRFPEKLETSHDLQTSMVAVPTFIRSFFLLLPSTCLRFDRVFRVDDHQRDKVEPRSGAKSLGAPDNVTIRPTSHVKCSGDSVMVWTPWHRILTTYCLRRSHTPSILCKDCSALKKFSYQHIKIVDFV